MFRNRFAKRRGALAAAPAAEAPASSSWSVKAAASATEEQHEAGVSALHDLIVFTRRENNDLRRRLHAVNHEEVGASSPDEAAEDGGPVAGLASLLDTIIPVQLRHTRRYRPLDDALTEWRAQWRDRERRLHALQAALLGAEATVATLQVRSGQVMSGQVRSGQVRSGQVRSSKARQGNYLHLAKDRSR